MGRNVRELFLEDIGFIAPKRVNGSFRYVCFAPIAWSWQTIDQKIRTIFPRAVLKSVQKNVEKQYEKYQRVMFDF